MIFDIITGTYDSYDGSSITNSSASYKTDQYKGWICTIDSVEHYITSNDATTLYFSNTLADVGTYSINFITRAFLKQFESDLGLTTRVTDDLITKKTEITQLHFTQKIKSFFRAQYNNYTDIDPITLIYNLYEVQTAFAYYLIAEIYEDLSIETGDSSDYKKDIYMAKYRELVDISIDLLAMDSEQVGELSNADLAESKGKSTIITR